MSAGSNGQRPHTIITGGRIRGDTFALDDAQRTTDVIWGDGPEVLWAAGESLMLFAPQGTCKTTLAQRLALHRIGACGGKLLGYPVRADERPVLYLAMDRPRQAGRSLRRMVTEDDRDALHDRLVVWRGPLPIDIAKDPLALAPWVVDEFGAGTIVVDSLKDLAVGLSKDEVGSAVNIAFQACTAGGIEVVTLHHPRKANADNREPSAIDDVYGSTWLTSGAGSVVCIWGEAGDRSLSLKHLKQPEDPVGPFRIAVNHVTGQVSRVAAADALGVVREAGVEGATPEDVAKACRQGTADADLKWARRQLADYAKRGLIELVGGASPVPGHGGTSSRYVAPDGHGTDTPGGHYLQLLSER